MLYSTNGCVLGFNYSIMDFYCPVILLCTIKRVAFISPIFLSRAQGECFIYSPHFLLQGAQDL